MNPQLDFLPGIVGEQNNLTFFFTTSPFAMVLPTSSISLYLPGVNFTSESSIEVDGCGHTKWTAYLNWTEHKVKLQLNSGFTLHPGVSCKLSVNYPVFTSTEPIRPNNPEFQYTLLQQDSSSEGSRKDIVRSSGLSALLYENTLLISDTATETLSAITYRLRPSINLTIPSWSLILHLPLFSILVLFHPLNLCKRACTTQAPTFECQVEYGNTTSYLTQGESIILNFTASLYRNQLYEIVIKKVKNPVEQCHSNTRDRTVSITGLTEKLQFQGRPQSALPSTLQK